MSRIFYDHLTAFNRFAPMIGKHLSTPIEREEIWHIVDEITHHKVLSVILEKLPSQHHGEFLQRFAQAPHDIALISYLDEKIGENFQELLASDLVLFEEELLQIIQAV